MARKREEIESRATQRQRWYGVRRRFHGDSIFAAGAFPLLEFKGYQKPNRGENYESHVYSCHPVIIGDRGHGIEQLRSRLRSTAKFSGARSSKESRGGSGNFSSFLRYTEKASRATAEKDRPVCLVAYRRNYRFLHLAVQIYREHNHRYDSNGCASDTGDGRKEGSGSLGHAQGREQSQIPDKITHSRYLGCRHERRNFETEDLNLRHGTIRYGLEYRRDSIACRRRTESVHRPDSKKRLKAITLKRTL